METTQEVGVPVEGAEMERAWAHKVRSYLPTLAGLPLHRECGLFVMSDFNLHAVRERYGDPVRVTMRLGGGTLWEFGTRDNTLCRIVCSGYGVGHRGARVRALSAMLAPLAGVSAGRMYRRLARLEYGFFGLLWEAGWGLAEMPAPRW